MINLIRVKEIFQKKKIIFIGLFCIPIIFYIDKILLGELARLRFWDVINFSYPFYYDYGALVKEHGIFFWYQNISGGLPSFAGQFSPLYPLNFISYFMEPWVMYMSIVIMLGLMSIFGMYLFCKNVLKFEIDIAIICAISFFLTISATKHIQEEFFMAYAFPLFFYVIFFLRANNILKFTLKVIFVVLFFFISPPVMHGPYYLIANILVILLIQNGNVLDRRLIFSTILLWIGYAFFHLPQLYALYEYIPYIDRSWSQPEWKNISALSSNLFSYIYLSNSLFLIFVILFFSIKNLENINIKKNMIIFGIVILLIFLFRSPFMSLFQNTILEKADLRQIYSIIFFFINLFVFNFISYLDKNLSILNKFTIYFFLLTFIFFILFIFNPSFFNSSFINIELLKNFMFSISIISYLYFKKYTKFIFIFFSLFFLSSTFLLVKSLTLAEDSITWRMLGDLNFLKKHIDENEFNRVATIGIPNAALRYLGFESYGGQNAFFPNEFKNLNLKVINNEMKKFDQSVINLSKNYTYSLNLMLPYWVSNNKHRAFWDKLPSNLDFNYNILKKMGVTHIVTTESIKELDQISIEKYQSEYKPYVFNKKYSNNTFKKIIEKIENSRKYSQLIIYKITNNDNRVFFKDNTNEISYPNNIIKIKDGIEIEITNKNAGDLIIKNNFHHNWKAINNEEFLIIEKSEYGFQKLQLTPGNHNIKIYYEDKKLRILLYLSLIIGFLLTTYSLSLIERKLGNSEYI